MTISKILMRVPQERERRTAARMTGRYLITLQKDAHKEVSTKLAATGFKPCPGLPKIASAGAKPMPRGSQMMLPNIGVAVVDPGPDQEEALHKLAADEGAITAVEPERIVQASEVEDLSDYMRGWQDAVNALSSKLIREPGHKPAALGAVAPQPLSTWGLVATRVINSRLTGAGIKIAVLDTGFDAAHPDFQGRQIEVKNFVGDNTPFHDGHGHGTHCIGTAAGPLHPSRGPRYGVACEAQIFAARVLDDAGFGGDTNILQAIVGHRPALRGHIAVTRWLPGSWEIPHSARRMSPPPSVRWLQGAYSSLPQATKQMIHSSREPSPPLATVPPC